MNIAYVLNSGKVGGAENHVLELVRGFSSDNKVLVICPEGEIQSQFIKAGARVFTNSPRFDIDPVYIYQLYKIFKKEDIQIVHIHQLKTVVNALISSKLSGIKFSIAHVHSPISKWQVPLIKKLPNLLVNFLVVNLLADKVIALTSETKEERVKGEKIIESKICVIPNGVDIKKFGSTDEKRKEARSWLSAKYLINKEYLVGCLSRLTEEKGMDVFINSISCLQNLDENIFKNCCFFIAGEGHLRKELEKMVESKGLVKMVYFMGFLPEEDYLRFYQALDLFVFPSLHEGFGYVLVEAMASGTPTLSSDLPVLQEITGNGRVGTHFETNNPDDLAENLANLLKSKERRDVLSEQAQERVQKSYSMDLFIQRYRDLYKEGLDKRK